MWVTRFAFKTIGPDDGLNRESSRGKGAIVTTTSSCRTGERDGGIGDFYDQLLLRWEERRIVWLRVIQTVPYDGVRDCGEYDLTCEGERMDNVICSRSRESRFPLCVFTFPPRVAGFIPGILSVTSRSKM